MSRLAIFSGMSPISKAILFACIDIAARVLFVTTRNGPQTGQADEDQGDLTAGFAKSLKHETPPFSKLSQFFA